MSKALESTSIFTELSSLVAIEVIDAVGASLVPVTVIVAEEILLCAPALSVAT